MWNTNDGAKIYGEYKKGQMHGKATFETADGKSTTAIYHEGKIVENQ